MPPSARRVPDLGEIGFEIRIPGTRHVQPLERRARVGPGRRVEEDRAADPRERLLGRDDGARNHCGLPDYTPVWE